MLTCGLRTLMIHVGGMMTAAWAPREQHSSICCSMKHDTLLWYWNRDRESASRKISDTAASFAHQWSFKVVYIQSTFRLYFCIITSLKPGILLWTFMENRKPWREFKATREDELTACLHQEQLMATISLLWNVNFCWKPCGWHVGDTVRPNKMKTRPTNSELDHSFMLPPVDGQGTLPQVPYMCSIWLKKKNKNRVPPTVLLLKA